MVPDTLIWPELHTGFEATPLDEALAEGVAYVDDAFVPVREARIPLLDWGFLRSDAFQDTISIWDGRIFRLDDHLDRFERSAERLRMTLPKSRTELADLVHALVAQGGFRHAYVQLIMTRGMPPIGSRDPRACTNRLQAFAIPYVWIARPELQERGLDVHIGKPRRVPPASVDPQVKHYHWLDFQMGLFEAYDHGCDTVLLRDIEGNVAEGPGFNVMAVTDGRLVTPPATHVLDGMTRRTILELCRELDLDARETALSPAALAAADEAFLTTTAGGVLPVRRVAGQAIGDGRPGPVSRRLHRVYWERRAAGWLSTPVRYAPA